MELENGHFDDHCPLQIAGVLYHTQMSDLGTLGSTSSPRIQNPKLQPAGSLTVVTTAVGL